MTRQYLLGILAVLFLTSASATTYHITTCEELQNMSSDFAGDYILDNDIDCINTSTGTSIWDEYGFVPMGDSIGNPFTGSLDGGNHIISNLFINSTTADNIGIFGDISSVSKSVDMIDIWLEDINYIASTSGSSMGGLVGTVEGSSNDVNISNVHVTGNLSGNFAGSGVVGSSAGLINITISNCSFDGNVSGTFAGVGGIFGATDWSNTLLRISDSHSTGTVTGGSYVGGLAGGFQGSINNSYSTSDVFATGDYAGGLVGHNRDNISNSNATGDVLATGNYIGGLVGQSGDGNIVGTIFNSYSTGNVSGTSTVGGFVGYNFDTISSSYSTGNVSGTGNTIGGFVGYNEAGIILSSYSASNVFGGNCVGGFIGQNDNLINNSYATGNVSGDTGVGGFAGENDFIISNSYSTGNVSGSDEIFNNTGGFAGSNQLAGIISNSYSTGSVLGTSGVGGFTGSNYDTITNSYWFDQLGDNATDCSYTGDAPDCYEINTTINYFYNISNAPMSYSNTTWYFPPWDDYCNNSGYSPLAWQGLTNITYCEGYIPFCGNSIIESGEQCDDGNTANGDCCSSTCQYESAATVCRGLAGICDKVELCDGAGTCPANTYNSTDICRASIEYCDPAEACNGIDITCPTDISNCTANLTFAWGHKFACKDSNFTLWVIYGNLTDANVTATLNGVTYNLTYNSTTQRYEGIFTSNIEQVVSVLINASRINYPTMTTTSTLTITTCFSFRIRLWEQVELQTIYQNNNTIITDKNYDKQLIDPYINDFGYIIARNNDKNATGEYSYCNVPWGSGQALGQLLNIGNWLGTNLTRNLTNPLKQYAGCDKYWFRAVYYNGEANLTLPWAGNYSLYFVDGTMKWENQFAPPQIIKSSLFMRLGEINLPDKRNLTEDFWVSHEELNMWASWTDSAFIWMVTLLPILLFVGLVLFGFPIQLAGLIVIMLESIWFMQNIFHFL